jgi:hypothetical protein
MAFKYHPESCKSSTVVVGALNFDTSPGRNVKSSGLTIGFSLTISLSPSSLASWVLLCFFINGLIKVAGALVTSSSLFVSAKFSRIAFGGFIVSRLVPPPLSRLHERRTTLFLLSNPSSQSIRVAHSVPLLVVVVVRGRRIACRRKRATAVDDFEENWRLLAAAVDVDVVVPDIIFFA